MKTVILPKEYNYDFKLPYNDLTKSYIKRMRSKGFKIRLRGSGERAKWSLKVTNGRSARIFDSHIPLKYASWVRLYISKGALYDNDLWRYKGITLNSFYKLPIPKG